MSHIGVFPTGENPSAGPSQRKPPAARIDESAVVPGIPIASRAHHFPGVPDRDRKALACWSGWPGLNRRPTRWQRVVLPLNYIRKTTTLAVNARVTSPAKPHAWLRTPQSSRASAHRPPALLQPSRIVRDRSSARYSGLGPAESRRGLFYLPRPQALRVVSMMSFSSCRTSIPLLPLSHGNSASLSLVGADGFEPPCLLRPDLCRLGQSL